MIQGGQSTRFSIKAVQPVGIAGKFRRQGFEGYVAAELTVARAIDFAHSARTQWREDFVGAKLARHESGFSRRERLSLILSKCLRCQLPCGCFQKSSRPRLACEQSFNSLAKVIVARTGVFQEG